MCGIAGFIDRAQPPPEASATLDQMLALIAHRGPDGAGTHFGREHGFAMGMRRLSIIDLAGGRQPIWNEDGTVGCVFNGEIYNYIELREELLARGHRFQTESDTEVLVHLYEEAGPAFVERLRGMFAFVIYSAKERRLLLARDHFGQKPLYYALRGGSLAFASELKCLFALPWVETELDPEAFLDYAAWLSLPSPRTHFRGIAKLPAGHRMIVPLDHPAQLQIEEYWRYSLADAPTLTDMDAAVEELDAALTDSMRAHLRADVPLGVLLSSGLDSRAVAAYAQQMLGGGMQTFTVGFAGTDSEVAEAAATAKEIDARHFTLDVDASDLLRDLAQIAWHLDEPVGDPAAFAVRSVCRLAREHVKVLLSGEGSDELFGGYEQRYQGMLHTLARSDNFRRLAPFLPGPDPAAPASRWQRLLARTRFSRREEALALRREGFPGDSRHPRGLTAEQRRTVDTRTQLMSERLGPAQRDGLSELLRLDLEWQLAESLLQKADKMSMAASIELRTPLLDTRVAAVAARMDSRLKLPLGGPGKLVLRRCLGRRLQENLDRPKRGFPIPLQRWFQGPLREPLEASLFAADSACLRTLDAKLLRTACDDFQRGEWDGARTLYSLWLYNEWARQVASNRLQVAP